MTEKLWEVIAKRKAGTTFSTALGLAEPKAAAQEEIIGAQNLTHKIIDASFDCLSVIIECGIILMINEQSSKALGWSQQELIVQNIVLVLNKNQKLAAKMAVLFLVFLA
eukprot:scaffold199040_cov40-Cyclotella_meneghiniana.AAC.1